MNKKLVSRIFYGTFFLIFAIMLGIMVVGFIKQEKDNKIETERYESMIQEGSRVELTDEILEYDHDKFVQDSVTGRKTFISLLICFASVIVLFVVMYIFTLIMKGMEDGASPVLGVFLACFLGVVFILASFSVVCLKVIVPKLVSSHPEDDKYFFSELTLTDAQKEEKKEEVREGDHTETRTTVYYYLIEENGNRISTNKLLYSRYIGEGIYYAGQTDKGAVFSLYPSEFFSLSTE